jgi:pimeloyl-ACP methyl ester carboxylesterase
MVRLSRIFPGLLLLCLFATGSAFAQQTGLIDIRAEYAYRSIYESKTRNKAMAIADNGAYGFSYGYATVAEAERSALDSCNERSKYLSLRKQQTAACKLLATNATWHLAEYSLDPDWQLPVAGKRDQAMRKGRSYRVGKNAKGIILLVHGCNGLGDKVFTDIWGAYFNSLGYDLYAPDSFAVKRPKEACGRTDDFTPEQISEIWRLRIAQTHRTLNDLRRNNPGKPIYMWGHSEGGLIVQMIATDIAGIIVSGEECGAVGNPIAASSNVPFLYVWGEFDQFVNGVGYRITAESTAKCSRDYASHKPRFAILAGRSHIPWPWNETAEEAIASFLSQTSKSVASIGLTKRMRNLWKQTNKDRRYRKAAPHRAAAINNAGTSYMVWGLDNEEDAKQLALFGCARNTSKKTNIFRTGKHVCALVDVNGNAPK